MDSSSAPVARTRLRSVRAWPFAWKLRGAVLALLLIAAAGEVTMLSYGARVRERAHELAAHELSGLGLVRALLPRRTATLSLLQVGPEVQACVVLVPPSVSLLEPL